MYNRAVAGGYLRIGELSRRTGVSPELLRAWERRYELFHPDRSPGRFRLYSDDDVARVQEMRRHLDAGLSAAEAARAVVGSRAGNGAGASPRPDGTASEEPRRELTDALASFDEAGAQAAFDRLVGALSLDALLSDVVLPVLRDLGERCERGEITVAQEHFASNLLRGRLLGLGRGWGRGGGRHALLAAPAGDQHDLGLVVLGLALRDRGWRVTFLGADTPIETIADTARRVAPEVVVIATLIPPEATPRDEIRDLAHSRRVVVSGAGVTDGLAGDLGAEHFPGGPLEAAGYLAGGVPA